MVAKPNLGTWYLNHAILAGRTERDAVLKYLQAAYAGEYLTEAEHERRAGLALGAQECRELGKLVADLPYSIELPGGELPAPVEEGGSELRGVVRDVLLGFGVALLVMLGVLAIAAGISVLAGQS